MSTVLDMNAFCLYQELDANGESSYSHPCIDWIIEQGMDHQVLISVEKVRFDEDPNCFGSGYIEEMVDFKIEFESEQDAVMFRLVWPCDEG